MPACRSIRTKPVAYAKEANRRGMRTGPPPSSASSLPAAFFSLIAHASVVLAGLIMIPAATSEIESTPMVYIPIELVSIAESTNVAPVFEEAEVSEVPVEAESEAAPAPAAAAATPDPEDTVALDPPKPEAPKAQPKPAAKPTPAPPSKSLSSELDDILASVSKDTPAPKRSNPNADPASAGTGPPRIGVMKRMTASVTDYIRAQLISNKCWTDHSDMADARRLKATFRVWFGRNGKFSQPYQMVSPTREPAGDVPLMTFVAHARRALDMCNKIGWRVPEDYFKLPQPQYIDIEFLPKIATQ